MNDFREKLAQRRLEKPANENAGVPDAEIEDEIIIQSDFFGCERARFSPTCLDLRMSDGKFKALPYSYIVEINFDASEGIEIVTPHKKISVTGRNLKQLYDYLLGFRVKYIQANIGNDLCDDKNLFVKNIEIEDI